MPMSEAFSRRLRPVLRDAVEHFGTPFHLYDEQGISDTCAYFNETFAGLPFREYFAVKALPNPSILEIMRSHGFGFDCSSLPEIDLAGRVGARAHDVFFTSNNTSREELAAAAGRSALINIDDLAVLEKLADLVDGDHPVDTLSLRVNPGEAPSENVFLGSPQDAKFGIPTHRLTEAVIRAGELGVQHLGLHMMVASNVLRVAPIVRTLDILLRHATMIRERTGVTVEFLNLGGGIGIPYRPEDPPFDLAALGRELRTALTGWARAQRTEIPRLCFESGRYITGPHGVLVTRVVNRMSKWREYVGVDASMSSLMRPGLYAGAYHHISAPWVPDGPSRTVDVVGSLCENNDRFGTDRELPELTEGDTLLIHDTGAHGHAMGFTYNGRLRPKELLLRSDGSVQLIRRAEEQERDHFSTLVFPPDGLPARPHPHSHHRRAAGSLHEATLR
ncbi:diaminopimelate decarboxylase [Streptomyces jumonjinensis]|uniref:Diaminopimelate decarboxylase n=2 Tax=Streptomyces jumonjinensis TaxID=1945 RepID=A0A646KKA5_STRJU|nr:diaminopimelate decarboxylase [Streptomyces jumonjinensis]